MNYDIFMLYARDDASFAASAAKGLEKINISVLYKESLTRPSLGQSGPLQAAIENGCTNALYGIVVISKSFFKMSFEDKDLNFLHKVLLMEDQILHPIWYNVTQADVSEWFPKLAMGVALLCPPETIDSMARKFQVKLAGGLVFMYLEAENAKLLLSPSTELDKLKKQIASQFNVTASVVSKMFGNLEKALIESGASEPYTWNYYESCFFVGALLTTIGSPTLQQNVLTGFHSQFQYIPPKISTYRQSKSSKAVARLPTETTYERKISNASSVGAANAQDEAEKKEPVNSNIDSLLIAACFDEELREQISKRLDVYLRDLSNWKDLAAIFRITKEPELKKLQKTKLPTLSLLDILAQLDVTVGEFKEACCNIDRYDIVDYINQHLKP